MMLLVVNFHVISLHKATPSSAFLNAIKPLSFWGTNPATASYAFYLKSSSAMTTFMYSSDSEVVASTHLSATYGSDS